MDRPGVGILGKKTLRKKEPSREKLEKKGDGMFQFMNSLLQQPQQPSQSTINNDKKPTDTRKAVAKLQSELDKALTEYTKANEAYRRNKGSSMEFQFRTKLKEATIRLECLKNQMSEHQSHIRSIKEKQKMYTF